VFADRCDDLFASGIELSGDYITSGGLQSCAFVGKSGIGCCIILTIF